jgi:hypothetical protein
MGKTATSSRAGTEELADSTTVVPPTQAGGGQVPTDPSVASNGGGGLTRVTVNLNRHAVQALEALSEATGYSKTDTINRALQVYAIVQEIMERNDGSLNIKHDNGQVERVHIV